MENEKWSMMEPSGYNIYSRIVDMNGTECLGQKDYTQGKWANGVENWENEGLNGKDSG